MNQGQKIIKLLATIFAIFLAIVIIGSIVSVVLFGLGVSSKLSTSTQTEDNSTRETYNSTEYFSDIESISIDATINDIILEQGDQFSVSLQNVNTNCNVYERNKVLYLEDTSHDGMNVFSWLANFLDGK